MTAESYLAAGGLPPVPCLEDVEFSRALGRIEARIRHSPDVGVRTSMRSSGRVAIGLSGTVAIWTQAAQAGVEWLVEPAAFVEQMAAILQLTRTLWREPGSTRAVAQLADATGLDEDWIADAWSRCETIGEFQLALDDRQRTLGAGPFAITKVEVRLACAELRARLKDFRGTLRGAARLQALRQGEHCGAEEEDEEGLAA